MEETEASGNRKQSAAARLFFHGLSLWIALFAFAAPVHAQSQVDVDARVEPSVAMVGQRALYRITIENGSTVPELPAPQVDGLVFNERPSISQQQQIINFQRSSQVSLTWFFVPQRDGRFTIPGRSIEIRGERYRIPDVTVRVAPQDERLQGILKFEAELPEKPLFVGEFIPLTLKLYVRRDISVRNLSNLELQGDGLSLKELSEPTQRTVSIEGDLYEMVRWDTFVVPIRAGLTNMQFRVNVQWGDPSRSTRDFFGRPQLDYQDLMLTTEERELVIRELPLEDQPESFNGAIGNFELTAKIGSREVQAGEPIEMTVTLAGKGNFERIAAPEIPEPQGWRVYPPKTQFTPSTQGDTIGYEGRKVFEYLLIPESEAVTEVPGFTFAWFDPNELDYVRTVIDAEPVDVQPAAPDAAVARTFVDEDTPTNDATARQPRSQPDDLLRPLATRADTWVEGDLSPLRQWFFWSVQIVLAGVLAGTAAIRYRRQRLATDDRFARKVRGSKAVREWLQKATEAAQRHETEPFLTAAVRAVQESVAADMRGFARGQTLLLSDVETQLSQRGASPETRQWIAELFQRHDAQRFAGSRLSDEELDRLQRELGRVLNEIAKPSKTL